MGITLKINGEIDETLADYSVTEDSTPLVAGDTSGGIGQLDLHIDADDTSIYLLGAEAELSDALYGTARGVITSVSEVDGELSVTAPSALNGLAVTRTMPPFGNIPLSLVLREYFEACGVGRTNLLVDPAVDRYVSYPGWTGDVWTQLKNICAAEKLEITIVDDVVHVRAPRGVRAGGGGEISSGWQFDASDLAQTIEVYYYESEYRTDLFYPPGEWIEEAQGTSANGWHSGVQIISVGFTESVEFDVEVNASLISIDQPVCVSSVGMSVGGSVYTVKGTHDGKDYMIDPATWTSRGGSVTATIKPGSSNVVTIKVSAGSNSSWYDSYSLSIGSGDSEYSTLRISGKGVFTNKQKLTIPTGLSPDEAPTEVGTTIDNIFINTLDQAYSAAAAALGQYSGLKKTISGNMDTVDLDGGVTQTLGNIAGARLRRGDTEYRIRSASVNPFELSYTAEADTMFEDFNKIWAGKTYADFNTSRAGETYNKFNEAPLKRID
jgi:hypothetical protein